MILFYRDGSQWCAHAPQHRVSGYGETQGAALRALAAVLDEENIQI